MRCAPVTDLHAPAFLLARLPFCLKKIPIKDLVDQRRFSGPGNAGHAGENAERNLDVEILEIVLARAGDLGLKRVDLRRDFGTGIDFRPAR